LAARIAASWRAWLLCIAVLAAATLVMLPIRKLLSETHVALAYLLVVLFAGAKGGRIAAVTTAGLAFFCFDWFFLLPYGTLVLANPLHWFVLVAFLAASAVATRLFEGARNQAVLRESVRARDAVIASLSHDLRTPLTTIKAIAHDIAAEGDDRALTIEEESDRLHALVADVLDLSRLSSGAAHLSIEPNEAEDLLGAALQRVSGASNGRHIRVELDDRHPLLFGRFDFAQTLRVLVNLLDNALKYSEPTAVVDLAVKRDGAWLVFTVSDHGKGVPPGDRDRIFEPFYRPAGIPPDVPGAGLGLSIARVLAEAQAGSISYSEREGGGSVFTLRVPAIDVADVVAEGDRPSGL
jgi:two-component system, OmpR family, sensor histidine kinase KdpD